jgi:hypothetical protein
MASLSIASATTSLYKDSSYLAAFLIIHEDQLFLGAVRLVETGPTACPLGLSLTFSIGLPLGIAVPFSCTAMMSRRGD